jgi:hypothetical protein
MPDILNIHLGETPDSVLAKIKALYTVGGKLIIQPVPAQYTDAPDPRWLSYILASGNTCGFGATGTTLSCNDEIRATFSGPPNKGVLVGLERALTFAFAKQPTLESVQTALLKKYGANPIVVGTNPMYYYWSTNETGGPMTLAPPVKAQDCGAPLMSPTHNIRAYTANLLPMTEQDLTQWMNLRCHALGVYVRATLQSGSGMATVLDVRITDTAEDMRDALAGEKHIEEVNAAAKSKLQKQTQGNVPPI